MSDFADFHDELRAVAREQLASAGAGAGAELAWSSVVAAGWTGLEVPEHLDGAGATFAEVAIVLEEMGRAASAGPYLGAVALSVGALQLLEPSAGRDALLRDVAAGRTSAALALAADVDGMGGAHDGLPDPAAGGVEATPDAPGRADGVDVVSDGALAPSPPPYRLERSAEDVRVEGVADFVLDAPGAGVLLLPADDGGRTVLVALSPTTPGLTVESTPVVDATRSLGRVTASGATVDDESIWAFVGAPTPPLRRLGARASVAVASDSLGIAAAMLEATVAYAGVRQQFGRPIGSFQAVKHACADMAVQVAMARELVAMAVAEIANPTDSAEPGDFGERAEVTAASMAAAYAGDAAVAVAGKAMQLHGGIGYTWESDVHVYLKRAALNRSLFGSPAAHRRRLGASHA